MLQWHRGRRPRNRDDSHLACGEISSGFGVAYFREGDVLVPARFGRAGAEHRVAGVDDWWPGTDHQYVKVRTENDDTYILRYDVPEGVWEITLFRAASPPPAEAGPRTVQRQGFRSCRT